MPDARTERYHQHVASTRAVALGVSGATAAELQSILEDWAEDVADLVERDLATRGEVRIARTIEAMAEDLRGDLGRETGGAIRTTVDRVVEIHEEAALRVAEDAGVSGVSIEGPFDDVAPAAFAAVAERDELAESMVSIEDEIAEEANEIIREGVLRGSSPEQLGRRLRHFVVGADEIPDRFLEDRRTISAESVADAFGIEDPTDEDVAEIRRESGRIARRAGMIGRNEPMNAHQEARARSAMASPTTLAIGWDLSNRHPEFDVCDILAGRTGWDPFGLGPGVYPPAALPVRPHPDCLRVLRDVLAEPEDWGDDVSADPSQLTEDPGDLAADAGLPPSEQRAIRSAMSAPSERAGVRILP